MAVCPEPQRLKTREKTLAIFEHQTRELQTTIAVAQRQASPTPSPQHLQCDSQALIARAVQITMAVAHRHTLPTSVPQPLQCDSQAMRTVATQITMAVAHTTAGGPSGDSARRSPFWRLCRLRPPLWRAENPCCGNHYGNTAQRHFANIRAATITMRFRINENPCCANHHGSSAQTHFANMRAAAITMRFAGNENRCYANHNGSSAHSRGGPAATPRAAAPSTGSRDCARHCGELGGPSGDSARRSPFPIPPWPRSLMGKLQGFTWDCLEGAKASINALAMQHYEPWSKHLHGWM